ncbi:putative alkaline shock family protein YloU [Allocatelliglobosispora scoriae]|uniref:Putative alkaline shock family protein YloU n=1 Tax=Allocatelliglobosispora scoriae TaxID=643052 RepID=A0A841C379_9ACTN|nr:Asp23/Gls24 family envelope stress response protein [Allocatelliglobosispora scoriae]MBB5874218.1 putative alkaline shock family protein YloU [Allocatelliglobosispora scoriae]
MTSPAELKNDEKTADKPRDDGRGNGDPRAATPNGVAARRNAPPLPDKAGVSLVTDTGKTKIADSVVAKIAGLAARDIPGVYSMGTGMARRVGQLRSLIPGSNDPASGASQGVSVEVGEKEAAIDLDVVTWYGQSIVEVTGAVREHVIDQVENMTGLKVVEVNISVGDIQVEAEQPAPAVEARVQ